jgi:hypothetical protein
VAELGLVRPMRVSFLALLTLTLVSCDTYHHEQYKVSRAANVDDRAKVKDLLVSIASSSGFHDCYPISRAPHTVAFYCEMDVIPYSGAQLGAREVEDSIVVDLLHSLGSQTRAFNRAHKLLEPALAAAFGQRLSVVNPPEELHTNRSNQALQPTAGRRDD